MARETGSERRERQTNQRNQRDSADQNREEALSRSSVDRETKYSFTGKFGNSPPKGGRLEYPRGRVYTDNTDYVKFRFVEYTPPFAAANSNQYIKADGDSDTSNLAATNIYNNSIAGFKSSGLPSIYMYMPEDIGAEYGANWGGKGFTNTGAMMMSEAGVLLNAQGFSGFGQTLNNMGNAMTRGQALIADGVATAINALPGKIGGSVDINDVLGGIGGVILNPNAELLFSGFDLRSFGLNFKMTPKNEPEAKMIRDIITTFKRASLPGLGGSPGNSVANLFKGENNTAEKNNNRNFIRVPNFCIVEFMKGGSQHPYLTQFKPCAINSVKVSYTPDGQYSTYKDGSPVATQLTLAFTESKLVYSDEISYGGPSY